MKTLLLEEMSWAQVEEAIRAGMRTVVVYAASVEQHGPHLPEITDTVIGYRQAVDLAERLGDALVAPVIRPGLSPHHMSFPGSLTLRPEVFAGIVEDYIAAYVRHGFRTIILCSSHGGNFATMAQIAERENARYADIQIISGMELADLDAWLAAAEDELNLPKGSCGGHACCFETSLLLEFTPDLVRMDRARPGYIGAITGDVQKKFFEQGVASVSETGVMGDPTMASAEIGKVLFAKMMDLQESVVRKKLSRLPRR